MVTSYLYIILQIFPYVKREKSRGEKNAGLRSAPRPRLLEKGLKIQNFPHKDLPFNAGRSLWGKFLGSRGASSKEAPEWGAGQSPATFSPRISSADCCSQNSQCALSGERRRAFPPRVPRLRRNLHEAVRKPRADGIPIPCGARGSAPTPPESPR